MTGDFVIQIIFLMTCTYGHMTLLLCMWKELLTPDINHKLLTPDINIY